MHYLVAPLALPTNVISLLLVLCPALGFRRLPSMDYLPQLPCLSLDVAIERPWQGAGGRQHKEMKCLDIYSSPLFLYIPDVDSD